MSDSSMITNLPFSELPHLLPRQKEDPPSLFPLLQYPPILVLLSLSIQLHPHFPVRNQVVPPRPVRPFHLLHLLVFLLLHQLSLLHLPRPPHPSLSLL